MKITERALLGALVIITLIPIGILAFYWYFMSSDISSDPADWGNFGSLLGGAFTLLGGLATSLTLLFFYRQQKSNEQKQAELEKASKIFQQRQVEVIQKQIDSLTFEQYQNHRKHFIELLEKEGLKNSITFNDTEKLYHSIFNKNRPTHCEFLVHLEEQDEISNPLVLCIDAMEKIRTQLASVNGGTQNHNIARSIWGIHQVLGISVKNRDIVGGLLIIDSKTTTVHAHKFKVQIEKIKNIIDHSLFFSGNEKTAKIFYPEDEIDLVKTLIGISASDDLDFTLTKSNRGAIGVYLIHKITCDKPELSSIDHIIRESLSSTATLCNHFQRDFAKQYGQIIATQLRELPETHRLNAQQEIEDIKGILFSNFGINVFYL